MKNVSVWSIISYVLIGVGCVALLFMGKTESDIKDYIGLVAVAVSVIGDLVKYIISNVQKKAVQDKTDVA